MRCILESYPHQLPRLKQNNLVTKTHSLSSILCPTKKTFSVYDSPSFLSACPSLHTPHSAEGLSLPCEYDLSAGCIPQSRIPVNSQSPSEKVFANTLAPQDLGHGGDISESKRYDTPYDRRCGLNILFPPRHLNISPPTHSPTGKPVELCPTSY